MSFKRYSETSALLRHLGTLQTSQNKSQQTSPWLCNSKEPTASGLHNPEGFAAFMACSVLTLEGHWTWVILSKRGKHTSINLQSLNDKKIPCQNLIQNTDQLCVVLCTTREALDSEHLCDKTGQISLLDQGQDNPSQSGITHNRLALQGQRRSRKKKRKKKEKRQSHADLCARIVRVLSAVSERLRIALRIWMCPLLWLAVLSSIQMHVVVTIHAEPTYPVLTQAQECTWSLLKDY